MEEKDGRWEDASAHATQIFLLPFRSFRYSLSKHTYTQTHILPFIQKGGNIINSFLSRHTSFPLSTFVLLDFWQGEDDRCFDFAHTHTRRAHSYTHINASRQQQRSDWMRSPASLFSNIVIIQWNYFNNY